MVLLPSSDAKNSHKSDSNAHFSAGDGKETSVWKSYANVYHLMQNAPFVRELRERHISVMRGLETILDAGCGIGLITTELATQNDNGRRSVVGLDLGKEMLAFAAEGVRTHYNVHLLRGDVHELGFGEAAFDGCVSNNLLYFVDDPLLVLSEMMRVTKRGGIISIASARPCINVEVLNQALISYFQSEKYDVPENDLAVFIESNRKLQQNSMKNLYEPYEISELLLKMGCSRILEKGTAYLGQNFFVVAERA